MSGVVGIDLGTTYSVIAHLGPNGTPEAIPDEMGDVLLPSVVSFAGSLPVVGAEAKIEQAAGETEVASAFKRSMGDPAFLLSFGGKQYDATALSAFVLAELKARAEKFTGTEVTYAVITVPAYFTHPQRTATIKAGKDAGLKVLKIISEPTAAALAYGLSTGAEPRHLVVYDLGGGTFDVSLAEISADGLRVIGTDGDHKLGGRDWDDRLLAHLQHRFADEFGADIEDDDAQALLVEAERLKLTLTARSSAEIRVSSGGHTGRYKVDRETFEDITRDLLDRTEMLTHQVLDAAGKTWDQIDVVVQVGGSTRMPMVPARIQSISGRLPAGGVHPDQAVAIGAALAAAEESRAVLTERIGPVPSARLPGPNLLQDVIAHSLGMIAESGDRSRYLNSVLIPKNLPIPARKERPYQFEVGGTGDNVLEIFLTQGETEAPQDCAYLGRYFVTGFGPGDRRTVVDIGYEYDQNGVVHVTAVDRKTTRPLLVTIDSVPADVPERFLGPPTGTTSREHATVYLAFDLSGSMSGHPLDESKRAAETFVGQCDLSRTSIGLIGFSDKVIVKQRATQNAAEIGTAIQRMKVGETGYGNCTHPFDELHKLLADVKGGRYAIVLADGVWANQELAVRQARRCHSTGIETVAIGFGGADHGFLQQIASSTEQGLFTDLNRLTETFSTIARELTEGGGRIGGRVPA